MIVVFANNCGDNGPLEKFKQLFVGRTRLMLLSFSTLLFLRGLVQKKKQLLEAFLASHRNHQLGLS
jgi:hypothetical protein